MHITIDNHRTVLGDMLYACVVTDGMEEWHESVHKTKAGAYMAGRKWLLDQYSQSHESRRLIGKRDNDFMCKRNSFRVVDVELHD